MGAIQSNEDPNTDTRNRRLRRKRDLMLPLGLLLFVIFLGYGAYRAYNLDKLNQALVKAAYDGEDSKVQDLINRGADVNCRFDPNGGGSAGFLDYLRKNLFRRKPSYKGNTPLMAAIA